MYTVVIADDEPVAINMVKKIIEKNRSDFQIMGSAENGEDALELIKQYKPDLVISDIRMPVIDGLTLASETRHISPDSLFILISGFRDFEYARSAIAYGVSDYLLKPITPTNLLCSIKSIVTKVDERNYQKQKMVLSDLCNGADTDNEAATRSLPYSAYYLALIRYNGLPTRFGNHPNQHSFYSAPEELISFYGRDEMEGLYFIPEESVTEDLLTLINRLSEKAFSGMSGYRTIIYSSEKYASSELPKAIQSIYHALNLSSVVGLSQTIDIAASGAFPDINLTREDTANLNNTCSYLLDNRRYNDFHTKMRSCHHAWLVKKRSQLWVEHCVNVIISIISRYSNKDEIRLSDSSLTISDIFYNSITASDLAESLIETYDILLGVGINQVTTDSNEYFDKIMKFMENHLETPLSTQDICKEFAVSQAYMSRLFRKYADMSFVQVLTKMRMERAKQIILDNPELYLKDIARMVGYEDQFYFSRVFHSYTGKSPSTWGRQECK